MLIGLGVGRLFIFVVQRGWTIKMPKGVPPMISRVFQGLLPFLTVGLVAMLINRAFMETPWGSFHQCIYTLIQQPLKGLGGSLLAFLLVTLIMQIFWFLGIHGTNVVLPLVTPIWLSMDLENLAAWQNGQELPNVLGLAFFNIVTWGLALGLVLLMCLSRSKQFKQVGRLALTPALFGITEPVIFGTPLVMNYHLMVPFITNNAIAITLSWALIKMGLVAKIVGAQTIFGLPLGFLPLLAARPPLFSCIFFYS
ncbi:PTS transporter subunit EIIC [Pseudocitrobacter faecalis]